MLRFLVGRIYGRPVSAMRLTVSGLLMATVWSSPGTLRLTDRIRSWSTMPMHYRGLDDCSQARALDMTAFDPAETIREYIAIGHINRLIEVRRYMDDAGQYHASIKLAICVFQQRRDVLALQRRVYAQRLRPVVWAQRQKDKSPWYASRVLLRVAGECVALLPWWIFIAPRRKKPA